MKALAKLSLVVAGLGVSVAALADPAGTWRTIDDETGQAKSLVRITLENGKYVGRIQQLLGGSNVCTKCEGKLKNQDISGKTILWGLTPAGGNKYSGGRIMDPKNDRTYDATITDNGNTLTVRGSIMGIGRSQTWTRQ